MFSDQLQEVRPETVVNEPPSTCASTFATPVLSAAVPDTVTEPETVAPAAGLAIVTVGGCASALFTVNPSVACPVFPMLSVARTVIV